MGKEQHQEWDDAQRIVVTVDLVEAAKKQLQFLAAVDRNRDLYEDPGLQRAIYRYNAFWLPLLAIHSENPVCEGPLVVPLDCEWIWHCHRLNPLRYKLDCEKLFGRIPDNHNVISSVQATSKSASEEIWNKMYPDEPYELDLNRPLSGEVLQENSQNEKFTSYDLPAAVKRQIPFTFQVSRPHVSDDLFLQEAVARYKGFLHLIRMNRKMNLRRFCVPTYDVDLIWHTHQLHPSSYCKDLNELIGMVLEHDDTDSDRSKGKKLDTGFSETTRQWEETFGRKYWKAGAMYRGSAPNPVTQVPFQSVSVSKEFLGTEKFDKAIRLSPLKAVEVLLEFTEVKNLPEEHKGKLSVSFSKKQCDQIFNTKQSLNIFSESGEKQVACFQCEATGEFLFELMSQSPSKKPTSKSLKLLGSCSFSLEDAVASRMQLSADKWLSVKTVSGIRSPEPVLLHVSISFSPPTPAPQVFHLELSQPFFKNSCFLPLLRGAKAKQAKGLTHVVDDDGNDVFSLQMRNNVENAAKCTPGLLKEVYCIRDSGEKHKVAEFLENHWLVRGTHGSFKLQNNSGVNGHVFELVGYKLVRLFPGRRLEFEPKHCGHRSIEQNFMTAVEFSADYPYGKAVALIDLNSGTFKAVDEWIILPGITLAFILSDILAKEGDVGLTARSGDKADMLIDEMKEGKGKPTQGISETTGDCEIKSTCDDGFESMVKGAKCSGKCGSGGGCKAGGFESMVKSAKCSGTCGSGGGCKAGAFENMAKIGETGSTYGGIGIVEGGKCGSGCSGGRCGGGGCTGMVQNAECVTLKNGGCGGGCNGSCGGCGSNGYENMVKSSKCGSRCGGGRCGGGGCRGMVESAECDTLKSGGCGGGCNGSCANTLSSDNAGISEPVAA